MSLPSTWVLGENDGQGTRAFSEWQRKRAEGILNLGSRQLFKSRPVHFHYSFIPHNLGRFQLPSDLSNLSDSVGCVNLQPELKAVNLFLYQAPVVADGNEAGLFGL
jgi:hypothetical protein